MGAGGGGRAARNGPAVPGGEPSRAEPGGARGGRRGALQEAAQFQEPEGGLSARYKRPPRAAPAAPPPPAAAHRAPRPAPRPPPRPAPAPQVRTDGTGRDGTGPDRIGSDRGEAEGPGELGGPGGRPGVPPARDGRGWTGAAAIRGGERAPCPGGGGAGGAPGRVRRSLTAVSAAGDGVAAAAPGSSTPSAQSWLPAPWSPTASSPPPG